jgi:methionyl aminopeptidase
MSHSIRRFIAKWFFPERAKGQQDEARQEAARHRRGLTTHPQDPAVIPYGPDELASIRSAAQIARDGLREMASLIRPGVTTDALNDTFLEFCLSRGAMPAVLNYRGFGKAITVSVNDIVCHGLPNEKPLKEGDIIGVTAAVHAGGFYARKGSTFSVGTVPERAEQLVSVGRLALDQGIGAIRPGRFTGAVGAAIERCATEAKMSVVRDFCGAGIGREMHGKPHILNYGAPADGIELLPGMVFTVQPMINLGRPQVKLLSDGWTAVTRDRSLSAEFCETVAVSENGAEVLTA